MAELGLGFAALGRPGYMTVGHSSDIPSSAMETMGRHAAAMCDAAYAAGIRHFDVARSYGRGEHFLRGWLDRRKPLDVIVSSKWGYRYAARWEAQAPVHEVKDHSLAHLENQWPESRTTLGWWLKVLQIHSATLESRVFDDEAVLDRLAWLKESGLSIGFSASGARQAEVVRRGLSIERSGKRLFDWVQATWNLLEPSAGPALAEAHAMGVKVIVKEPLANGRLTARGDVPALVELAQARQVRPDALALATALAQPWAHVVLSGAATLEQLASNLEARTVAPVDPMTFAVSSERYWTDRSKLPWT
jgi:aryl-alcohol dehydrogenase-like predicted oxidoreductase